MANLAELQLTGQHHHIRISGKEANRAQVAHICLHGYMHLKPDAVGIGNHGQVRRNHGIHSGILGLAQQLLHAFHFLIVDNHIAGQVGLGTAGMAQAGHLRQVLFGEIHRGTGTHVVLTYTEIHTIGTGAQRSGQRFERPRGGHDFQLLHARECTCSHSKGQGGTRISPANRRFPPCYY